MRHLPPDPRFRTLLVTALALAGCGNKADPEPPTPSPERTLIEATAPDASCDQAAGPAIGSDLKPDEPVDAVGLFVRQKEGRGGAGWRYESARGEICAGGGTDCLDGVSGAPGVRSECHQIGCFDVSLVWARGGSVGEASDRAALLAFLGPIDAVGDARAMVWAEGFEPTSCAPTQDEAGTWTVGASKMVNSCPIQVDQYDFTVTADGTVTQTSHRPGEPTSMCIGRLPPGLAGTRSVDDTVASWLARAAQLEAASVHAFQQLHAELVHHGAPAALREAALACAEDEIRHARIMTELARAAGIDVQAPEVAPTEIRSLVAIARDNAAEGCGREAWGALVGLWQAEHADRAEVRDAMRSIASDEVRHAEFSFALDAWLRSRLSPAEQSRVDRTLRKARRRLAAEAQAAVPDTVRQALGLPSPGEAVVLWESLAA